MAELDDEPERESGGLESAAGGPRRSTFTPPAGRAEAPAGVHDDDELAAALADDLSRLYTGPISAQGVPDHEQAPDAAEDPAFASPAPAAAWQPFSPAGSTAQPQAPVAAEPPAPAAESPAAAAEPPAAPDLPSLGVDSPPPAAFDLASAPAPPPPPVYQPSPPSAAETPAWVSAPAPDPSQAVPLDGPPQAPARRSMADDELAHWVQQAGQQPGSTLQIIEQMQAQLQLREEEAQQFRAWENTMRTLGTPEALAAIEEARPEFTGVLPVPPASAGPAPADAAPAAEQSPDAAAEAPTEEPVPLAGAATPVSPAAEPVSDAPVFEIPVIDPSERDRAFDELFAPEAEAGAGSGVSDQSQAELPDEPESAAASWSAIGPEASAEPASPAAPEASAAPESAAPESAEPESAEAEPFAVPTWSLDAQSPEGPDSPVGPDSPAETVPSVEQVWPVQAESPADAASPVEAVPPVETGTPFAELFGADPQDDPQDEIEAQVDDGPEASAEPWALSEPAPEAVPEAAQLSAPAWEPTSDPAPDPAPRADPEPDLDPELEPEPELLAWAPPPLIEPPLQPAAAASSPTEFSFDDLLAGAGEEPLTQAEPEALESPEDLLFEPAPLRADEAVPTDTGSVRIIDRAYEEDLGDDAVDDIDRVLAGGALVGIEPPSGPIPTARIPEDELVLLEDEPALPGIFSLEAAGAEPTPHEQRAAWSSRLFWMWFAASSSILSLGLGAVVFAIGLSLRQAIVAVFVGVALSFLPLGLSTLAGKRSGQPIMVVSRATFGLLGNILPALLALITRVFWGAVMLWLIASAVAIVLAGAELDAGLGEGMLLLIGLGAGLVLAAGTAFLGFGLLARLNVVLAVISGLLIVGLIAMTASYIDIDEALTNPDGPWILTLTGAVLVFSFVGMVWAHSGGDLARYQSGQSSGAGAMLSSSFGAALPAFVLVGYGALLAASNKGIAQGFVTAPLDTLALLLPNWYPIPLLAATALSLLAGLIITLYSGGFALQSLGLRLARPWSVLLVAALTGAIAALLTFGVSGLNEIFRDAATTLAVPTAAWIGLLSAELMIRSRRYASGSLLKRGGVYPDVHWVNLSAFVVISAIGFGLTTASVSWLSWQGYLFGPLGQPLDGDLAGTDLGVLVALLLGLLVPIVAGIPGIRRQEAVEAE